MALPAGAVAWIEQRARAVYRRLGVLALELGRRGVDLLEMRVAFPETARLERAQQCAVERVRLGDAAHLAAEHEALVAHATAPAVLRLLRQGVEPLGDPGCNRIGLLGR